SQGCAGERVVLSMERERASISTHAIMDKVREMELFPVVPEEGRFTGSTRLARAMEIAQKSLSAPESWSPRGVRCSWLKPVTPRRP
ncbi:MAG TPA: hypothetical protein VGV35_14110, partial [Bryobacteraceae bacterium]|nr:hypothetical protein [Bryobacteraceae bacterium]